MIIPNLTTFINPSIRKSNNISVRLKVWKSKIMNKNETFTRIIYSYMENDEKIFFPRNCFFVRENSVIYTHTHSVQGKASSELPDWPIFGDLTKMSDFVDLCSYIKSKLGHNKFSDWVQLDDQSVCVFIFIRNESNLIVCL